jgi:hypothetical protein
MNPDAPESKSTANMHVFTGPIRPYVVLLVAQGKQWMRLYCLREKDLHPGEYVAHRRKATGNKHKGKSLAVLIFFIDRVTWPGFFPGAEIPGICYLR